MHSTARRVVLACGTFTHCLAATIAAVAADFRVDSEVYAGSQAKPRSTNVTLFHGHHVYDFLDTPPQITIYDLGRGRIVLIDPDRRLKCEITDEMLSAFEGSLRRTKSEDPLLRFALSPAFDEQLDDKTKVRTFASKHLTYRVTPAEGHSQDLAEAYRAFSDASARLNALVNRGSLPPFPRLAVNEALAKAAKVPESLQVTVAARRLGGKNVVLRSQHSFRPRLLDSDLRRIEQAGAALADSRRVTLAEFVKPAANTND